ncbi:hypothetical protein VM1G_09146 [Cytospora mali]|uniref:Hemerythrin-like domain-containing protein n=1 Tax=Cytospora mali TaxID=578113 RepID=A0A194W9N9_CYTMA|nr:hypothetical protein VM1G_09146 [Valsa mali]
MTTRPSDAPWADEPFHLIATPSKRPELTDEKHSYVHVASEMTHVHNVLIRGLNAIIQQAPYVKTHTDPAYNKEDVRDLLLYVSCWVKMVEHHHWTEESFIFPEIERFSGKPGSMDDPRHQHELFHGGLEQLLAYANSTKPQSYSWGGPGGMKEIVDSFSKELMDHLYAEIEVFLTMKDLDSAGLKKTWDKGETIAKKHGSLSRRVQKQLLMLVH